MKITVLDLAQSEAAFRKLLEQDGISPRFAFTLGQMARIINVDLQEYEKARVIAFKQVGEVDPQTNQYKVEGADGLQKLGDLLEPLYQKEIELDISTISIKTLEEEKVNLTGADMSTLWWLIRDSEG